MTEFYFLRHGQTQINLEQRFNGATVDSPLTQAGIKGAEGLNRYLKDCRFEKIYCSPQFRAQTTLQLALAQSNHHQPLQYIVDERLREFHFGKWEGIPFSQVDADILKQYHQSPATFDTQAFQMESYGHLYERGNALIQEIYQQFPTGKILIVGHGVHLTLLIQGLLGTPIDQFRKDGLLPNASLTIVDYQPAQAQLVTWGLTAQTAY